MSKPLRLLGVAAATALALGGCAVQDSYTETTTTTRVATADSSESVFTVLDVNRDGFLSRGELDVLVGAAAVSPADTSETMFRRLDMDRDGFLSRQEASVVINTVPGTTFDQMDTNRDGFLSLAEAEGQLRWYAPRYPVYSWFDTLDTNRDGFLTRAEAAPLLNSARLANGRWTVSPWPPVGVTFVPPVGGTVYGPR